MPPRNVTCMMRQTQHQQRITLLASNCFSLSINSAFLPPTRRFRFLHSSFRSTTLRSSKSSGIPPESIPLCKDHKRSNLELLTMAERDHIITCRRHIERQTRVSKSMLYSLSVFELAQAQDEDCPRKPYIAIGQEQTCHLLSE